MHTMHQDRAAPKWGDAPKQCTAMHQNGAVRVHPHLTVRLGPPTREWREELINYKGEWRYKLENHKGVLYNIVYCFILTDSRRP